MTCKAKKGKKNNKSYARPDLNVFTVDHVHIYISSMCVYVYIDYIYTYIHIVLESMVNLVHPIGVTDESCDQSGSSRRETESRGPIESE